MSDDMDYVLERSSGEWVITFSVGEYSETVTLTRIVEDWVVDRTIESFGGDV